MLVLKVLEVTPAESLSGLTDADRTQSLMAGFVCKIQISPENAEKGNCFRSLFSKILSLTEGFSKMEMKICSLFGLKCDTHRPPPLCLPLWVDDMCPHPPSRSSFVSVSNLFHFNIENGPK